jgi:hypothetical protein
VARHVLCPAKGLPLAPNPNVAPAQDLKQPLRIVGLCDMGIHSAEQFTFALAPSAHAPEKLQRGLL